MYILILNESSSWSQFSWMQAPGAAVTLSIRAEGMGVESEVDADGENSTEQLVKTITNNLPRATNHCKASPIVRMG
jgi:hypothetical protein